jgi:hypothetical protein
LKTMCRRASNITQACALMDYPGAMAACHSAACV